MDRYSLVSEKRCAMSAGVICLTPLRGHSLRICRFNGNLVAAFRFRHIAVVDRTFTLGRLFEQIWRTALRALLGNRLVPQYEIAFGIFQAAVEDLAPFRTTLDKFTATTRLGARHAYGLRL